MDQIIPFIQRPLKPQSFFQKLFKQLPKENAIIELNNLLAIFPLDEITEDNITAIEQKYGLNLIKTFYPNLEEFYAVLLNFYLKDKMLSDEEIRNLEGLKNALGLYDASITFLNAKIGSVVYKQLFQEVVSDGEISEQEKKFLKDLENKLRLPDSISQKISEEVRTRYIHGYMSQVISNQTLSPEDEKELDAIAKNLNVNLVSNKSTAQQLERLKLYWSLENLTLPIIEASVKLQKNEKCFFTQENIDLHGIRRPKHAPELKAYSTNLSTIRGAYLNNELESIFTRNLKVSNSGTLCLTNKRVLLLGSKKSTIALDKVMQINLFSDGVEIIKNAGNNIILRIDDNADVFAIILDRLIKNRNI